MEWLWVLVFLGVAITAALLSRPRSPEVQAQRAYEDWLRDCISRGMSDQQIRDEGMFRRSFATLRRRATDAAIAWPEKAYDEARRIAIEEGENLAIIDKTVARRFLRTVSESPWTEIFYPEALAAIDDWWKKNGPAPMTRSKEDLELDFAAFTTLKD